MLLLTNIDEGAMALGARAKRANANYSSVPGAMKFAKEVAAIESSCLEIANRSAKDV